MSNLCNIKCVYCMREKYKPPQGMLKLEQIKALLKKMPYINGVCIMGLCEPFLNPETPNVLRWLKDEGKYSISITTNGMVDLNEDKLDALLRADDMVFSIDTSEPETFKYLRGGADLKRVTSNMERLIKYKKDRGMKKMDNPPIHINAVVTSKNFHQIPDLIKMLGAYADDLKYLMVDPVTRPDYQEFEEPLMLQREEFDKHIEEYRELAKKSPLKIVGFDYMLKESRNWRDCHLTWDGMFVQPNGDAYFCYDYEYVIGNVFKDDPLKVWNSDRAKIARCCAW
jgi:MoaA/NifB/PqqE/SkfB family radical SAM enzyme